MRPANESLTFRRAALLGVGLLALLLLPAQASGTIHAYSSPLTFTWTQASGTVDLYHVYLSVDGGAFGRVAQVTSPSYQFPVVDGRRYALMVQAENTQGTGPPSDPSEEVLVFLNGPPVDPEDPPPVDPPPVDPPPPPPDPSNRRPVANAGPDRILDPTRVTLDGSGSRDPDGDPLTFHWTQTAGPPVALSDAGTPQPWFLGTTAGMYRFRLVVNDGRLDSFPGVVNVTIRNVAPTADAGPDQVVYAGSVVTLDGGDSSDPNNDTLGYRWSQKEGPPVVLQTGDTPTCWFLPEISGVYRFSLVVSDGRLSSAPDEVRVVVHGVNHVPTADAGPDQTVRVRSRVTLDGSDSSDPDGDPLTYLWTQRGGPALVFLIGARTAHPYFTPARAGVYRFRLVVHDGLTGSVPDEVTVTVESGNRAPVAVVDEFVSAAAGDRVELNGEESFDPDGDPLAFAWSQVKGPSVSLEGGDTAVAGFYALTEATLRFHLVVDDGELQSAPAVVEVHVYPDDDLPLTGGDGSVPAKARGSGCSTSPHPGALPGNAGPGDGFFVICLFLPALVVLGVLRRRLRLARPRTMTPGPPCSPGSSQSPGRTLPPTSRG